MEKELAHKDIWNSEYRDVRFEIIKWRLGGNSEHSFPCWNYYLYLPIDQIPLEFHKYFVLKGEYRKLSPDGQDYLSYEYGGTSYISDLDWHGGITFYEKQLDGEGKLIGVKLGCDYAHHFDEQEGYPYTIEYVFMEAKQTIDKLHKLIPNLKVSCRWNGKFYDKQDCEELPQGGYLAKENHNAWYEVRVLRRRTEMNYPEHKHPHGVENTPPDDFRVWVCDECGHLFTDEEIREDYAKNGWGHLCKSHPCRKGQKCESHLESYIPDQINR